MAVAPLLGKYRIIKGLGSGATADVFYAVDTQLNREVALKILKPSLVADRNAFERFTVEAQAAARLFHDHIATVLDMGSVDGRYYIAMKYVSGRALDKVIAEKGPLPWPQVLRLAQQIGQALDFAHAQRFLHRDVKTSNILLSDQGDFVLTDFGLTRAMENSHITSTTGAILGTPPYIPPEVWNGEPSGPTSDQYAFACVVYEAITGKTLFAGATPQQIITLHLMRGPQLPQTWPAGVPQGITPVLLKALHNNPSQRFPSMRAFSQALEQAPNRPAALPAAQPAPPRQPAKPGPRNSAAPAPKPARKRSRLAPLFWMLSVIAALGCLLAGGMGYLYWDRLMGGSAASSAATERAVALSTEQANATSQAGGALWTQPGNPSAATAGPFSEEPTPTPALPTAPSAPATLPPTLASTAQPAMAMVSSAWKGEYYSGDEFVGQPTYVREDAEINFDWGESNPAPDMPLDNFRVRWTKCAQFEERYYVFQAKADDRLRVWIDDTEIINIYRGQYSQKFYVSAGNHCLKAEYTENQGLALVYLFYEPDEQPTPVAGGETWKGEYYGGDEFIGQPTYVRQDAEINFDWGESNPAPDVPFNDFVIRWTKCAQFEENYYLFQTKADDRLRVWLDDTEIINIYRGQDSQKFFISAGNHCLKAEYTENQGVALVYLFYEPTTPPTGAIIPSQPAGLFFLPPPRKTSLSDLLNAD